MKQWGNFVLGMAAILFLLTGCTGIQTNIEEFMRPPKLTGEQTQIYNALDSVVGELFRLKYPSAGEYHSAFVLRDLDGDGENEALAFYQLKTEEKTAMVAILDKVDGAWRAEYSLPGLGAELESVAFARTTSSQREDVLLEWRDVTGQNKMLGVYTFDAGRLTLRYSQGCSSYEQIDYNRDGVQELVVLTQPGREAPARADLVERKGEELIPTGKLEFDPRIASFEHTEVGLLADGTQGLFVDVKLVDGDIATQVLINLHGHLEQPPGAEELLETTRRTQAVFCGDRSLDGVIEIPQQLSMPGYESLPPPEREVTTVFLTLSGSGNTAEAGRGYINLEDAYLFVYPSGWEEQQITVIRQRALDEVSFFYFGGSFERSREVARIKTVSHGGFRDQLQLDSYHLLQTRGLNEYYIYLPDEDVLGEEFNYTVCEGLLRPA